MAFVLVFRRYAPFSSFGFGFEGDCRTSPSVSTHASSRTIGTVLFQGGGIGSVAADSSGTAFVGLGKWVHQLAGRHKSRVSCSVTRGVTTLNSLSFIASTAGSNPMVPVVAPDIDTFVDFRADWIGTSLKIQGSIRGDDFPNAEIFLLDRKGQGCLLFDGRTTGGKNTGPITRLVGSHESVLIGRFNLTTGLSPDGSFLHPRAVCPVTRMEQSAGPRVPWQGGGGKSGGAGASSTW